MNYQKLVPLLRAILIPGMVFQSVVTGGGFATGREIVQYCARHGIAAPAILAIVFMSFIILTFLMIETARIFQTFDYRSWSKSLIKQFWIGLDIIFIVMSILVCSIVISGAVEIVNKVVSIPAIFGFIVAIVIIVIITTAGKKYVLFTKVFGACFLSIGYFAFAFYTYVNINPDVWTIASETGHTEGWLISSLEYVGYNTVALPACLYAFSFVKTRKQSFAASIISGLLLVIPMGLVAYSILSIAPASLSSPVPLHDVVLKLNKPMLLILYYSILVWTLLDTAIGMLYAIVGRIESQIIEIKNTEIKTWHRITIAVSFVLSSIILSKFGIIALVAKGYSIMSYCFIFLLVLPLLTRGIKIIYQNQRITKRKY